MSDYRLVLAHVSPSERSAQVLATAAALARAQAASLRAVYPLEAPRTGAYLSPETAMIAAQIGEQTMYEREARARQCVQQASTACGLEIGFETPSGDPAEILCRRSQVADLVVLGQPLEDDPLGPSRRLAWQVLVAAGCPVLFVPGLPAATGTSASCGARVLVAWSSTRESARALRDALPLLQRAEAVEVLRFGFTATGVEEPLDGVLAYLRAHGITAACTVKPPRQLSFTERVLTPTVVDASIAELLLSHAADMNADLIVMGGYGHTRAHELVLGGVTRKLLGSMTVPTLMSH